MRWQERLRGLYAPTTVGLRNYPTVNHNRAPSGTFSTYASDQMAYLRHFSICLMVLALQACARSEPPPTAFAAQAAPLATQEFPFRERGLAGRTITVDSIDDLKLAKGEVVLTFDDGPIRRHTRSILKSLGKHDVKATFFMVGQMADAYPTLVREVANQGHTIGSHTQNHLNLARINTNDARQQIASGRVSLDKALIPLNRKPAPFFRFPYLADTPKLRDSLARQGIVVIDPTIDSKDYWVSKPSQIRNRIMKALRKRGSGIVLLHDIHARTAQMLPGLLETLDREGYRVVHLVPGPKEPAARSTPSF